MNLASEYDRPQLERSLHVTGRVKSDNEKGYYIVDAINQAISEDRKIRFKYFDYNSRRRKILRHDGKPYGTFEGIRNGRYFTDFTEKTL